jgi:hypothetical protein
MFTATTCQAGTNFNTVVAVWDGTTGCGGLLAMGCNDNITGGCPGGTGLESKVTWTATAGTPYYVSVGGSFGANGNFSLLVSPNTTPILTFISAGPGSIGYQVTGGPSNGATFTAVTLNLGLYPNAWFFGIDIGLAEVIFEWNTGFPFTATLDGCGGAVVGPLCCVPSGLNLYGVSVVLPIGGGGAVVSSVPATGTVP